MNVQYRFILASRPATLTILSFLLSLIASVAQAKDSSYHWHLGKIVRHARFYTVKINYPICNANDREAKVLNHQIKTFVHEQMLEGCARLGSYCGDGLAMPKGYLISRYHVELNGPQLVSIRFDFSLYAPGAAHPEDWTTGFNYSIDSRKRLRLSDVFSPEVCYGTVLSVLSIDHFLKSGPSLDIQWLKEGAGPNEDNFNNFLLRKDVLEVYFNEYQVEAYAAGLGTVDIPYIAIRKLVRPGGVVELLARKANRQDQTDRILSMSNLQTDLARIAIGSYSRAINMTPENGIAYYERGNWYQKINRDSVGKQDLQRAFELGYRTDSTEALGQ